MTSFTKKILAATIFLTTFFAGSAIFSQELELFEGPKSFNESILTFEPTELIVKFKNEAHFKVEKLKDSFKLPELLREFRNKIEVEYAEPNFYAFAYFTPNDPYYRYQWHLQDQSKGGINMPFAWDLSQGEGVTVAVVDTGVAYENYGRFMKAPDLANTIFVPGYNFINNTTHANDDNGHGTHVAGTIAQSTNNNLGVAGGAFKAKIMPVKVLNKSGSGTYAQVASGIRFAADNGAKIINLSLGGPSPSQTLKDAVDYAKSKGALVIAAAGNDGKRGLGYPAAYTNSVMAVAATRIDKTKSYYSNYGPGLSISAPGGDLNVDQNNDRYGDGVLQQTLANGNIGRFGYYFYQGTSMATPHVSAVAALVASKGITNPTDIRNILESTTLDLGASGWDEFFGWGLVDAYKAIQEAIRRVGVVESANAGTVGDTTTTIPTNTPKVKIKSLSIENNDSIFSILNGSQRLIGQAVLNNESNENVNINIVLALKDANGSTLNWPVFSEDFSNIQISPSSEKQIKFFVRTDRNVQEGQYFLNFKVLDKSNGLLDETNYNFHLTSVNKIWQKDSFSEKFQDRLLQKINTNFIRRFF